MRPDLLLLPLLLLAGCVHPTFQATKIVELTLPAAAVTALECHSHNGGITVTGDPGATGVALRAELSVRGYTQPEADANLHLLGIGREEVGGTLRIRGTYPEGELGNRSPSFRFTMTVPTRLAVTLVSHNGDVKVRGIEGATALETHNGNIDGAVRTNRITATTHNGSVDLRLDGDGALDGEITSHNGDVTVTLDGAFDTVVGAATHNGSVTPPANATDVARDRRRFEGTLGAGGGALVVVTHNGDVVIR